jgi:hypothetical protein
MAWPWAGFACCWRLWALGNLENPLQATLKKGEMYDTGQHIGKLLVLWRPPIKNTKRKP